MKNWTNVLSEAGASKLNNKRHETFAQILARPAPPSLLSAWCESAGDPKPVATAGRRVSASKAHARPEVLDRIAHLRRQRLSARSASETLTEARLSHLMRQCTEELVRASEAAERVGLGATQAAQIRQKIVVHAGRADRMKGAPDEVETDVEFIIPELHWCTCEATQ